MKTRKNACPVSLAVSTIFIAAPLAMANPPQVLNYQGRITTDSTTYDAAGNYTSTIDPIGNTTTYSYDSVGDRSTTSGGITSTYSYDGNDKATTPTGNPTTYTYDAVGNDTDRTTGDTPTTSQYDQVGNTQTDTDALGNVTQYQYDSSTGAGTTTETDPLGRVTTYQYDAVNGATSASGSDPVGNTTTYQYDAVSRQIQVTDSIGNVNSANNDAHDTGHIDFTVPSRYQYDATGLIQTTDGGSSYDLSLEDLTSGLTIFTYDAQSPDALGNVTTFQYDSVGGPNTGSLTGSLQGMLIPGDVYSYQYSYDVNQNPLIDQTGSGAMTANLTLTAIPEPGTISLIFASATTLLCRRRRTSAPAH